MEVFILLFLLGLMLIFTRGLGFGIWLFPRFRNFHLALHPLYSLIAGFLCMIAGVIHLTSLPNLLFQLVLYIAAFTLLIGYLGRE